MASKKQSVAGEALGLFTDFVQGVRQGIKRAGGTDEHLKALRKPEVIAAVVDLIMAPVRVTFQFLDRTLSVTMEMARTLDQLIADGKYDWVNEDIKKKFTVPASTGSTTLDVHLLHYNKDMSTDAVLADMERQGLRPATLQELLWIGIRHPELQREFPIVALGTVQQVGLDRRVAYLDRSGAGRALRLHWLGLDWDGDCRFAAVRK